MTHFSLPCQEQHPFTSSALLLLRVTALSQQGQSPTHAGLPHPSQLLPSPHSLGSEVAALLCSPHSSTNGNFREGRETASEAGSRGGFCSWPRNQAQGEGGSVPIGSLSPLSLPRLLTVSMWNCGRAERKTLWVCLRP